MSKLINAALVAPISNADLVYGKGRRNEIARRTILMDDVVTPDVLLNNPGKLKNVEVIFTTWGMPSISKDQVREMPNLRGLFYAAGSVQGFARPFIESGVTVVSAWRANAIAVAQYTVAQILLSTKGYFRNVHEYDGSKETYMGAYRGPGSYGATVALLGVGAIGRSVIELLRPFDLKIVVFDPFLDDASALALGVDKVDTLAEAFSRGFVVSNHLADKPETENMIDGTLLSLLQPNATFINTGRGRTVVEYELVRLAANRPDLTMLLDVTHPEPPGAGSPITQLKNIHITSHIAGAINDEVLRMADLCIAEFDRFVAGQPLRHAVTLEALATMA